MMNLKTNVGKYFGKGKFKGNNNLVGVEIEMEYDMEPPPRDLTNKYWVVERDGSLRGEYNREYVLRRPMSEVTAYKAIDKLSDVLQQWGVKPNDSVRAGVHVHINVRDLNFLELWSMVTCWYVLENLLTYTMCGEGRSGNHFCLRATDADVVVVSTLKAVDGDVGWLGDDNIRYSALNFCSLQKYGSLEFRGMRTPTEVKDIKVWVKTLLNLKENSKLHPNPRHVVENFSHGGELEFLRGILGHDIADEIIKRDPDYRDKMRAGVRIAQEIGYAKDDWDKEEEEKEVIEEVAVNYENLEDFANAFGVELD